MSYLFSLEVHYTVYPDVHAAPGTPDRSEILLCTRVLHGNGNSRDLAEPAETNAARFP